MGSRKTQPKPNEILGVLQRNDGRIERVGRQDALSKLVRRLGRQGEWHDPVRQAVEQMAASGQLVVVQDGRCYDLIALPSTTDEPSQNTSDSSGHGEEPMPAPRGQHHTKQPQMADGSAITDEVVQQLNGPVEVRRAVSSDQEDDLAAMGGMVMELLAQSQKARVSREYVLDTAKSVIRSLYDAVPVAMVDSTAESVFGWLIETRRLRRDGRSGIRNQPILYEVQREKPERADDCEQIPAEKAVIGLMKRIDELEAELKEANLRSQGAISEEELSKLLGDLNRLEGEAKEQASRHAQEIASLKDSHRQQLEQEAKRHEQELAELKEKLRAATERANSMEQKASQQPTIKDPKLLAELRRRGIRP